MFYMFISHFFFILVRDYTQVYSLIKITHNKIYEKMSVMTLSF